MIDNENGFDKRLNKQPEYDNDSIYNFLNEVIDEKTISDLIESLKA